MTKRKGDEVSDAAAEKVAAGLPPSVVQACEAASACTPRARSEDEKRMERQSSNRRSAKESRTRKRLMFNELQRSVARLAEENRRLQQENDTLKVQMSDVRRQLAALGTSDDGGTPQIPPMPMVLNPVAAMMMQHQQQAQVAPGTPSMSAGGSGGGDQPPQLPMDPLNQMTAQQQKMMMMMMVL